MYSGSDSAESAGFGTQWPLNPSAYQNIANNQVDWAALAQQWIIMKEAGPPPIPEKQSTIGSGQKTKIDVNTEGGEAPMDVENDKEESASQMWNARGATNVPEFGWKGTQQPWGWGNNWNPPPGVTPPGAMKGPLLPTPGPQNFNQLNVPPESGSDNATFGTGYNAQNADYPSGYWSSGAAPPKHIKPHNRRYSKVNVPRAVPVVPLQHSVSPPEPVIPQLDAAKRKQLPAWIREGLEKMERDKHKQLEKEKAKQAEEEMVAKKKKSEKETMEILKSTIKEQQRSKFESDEDVSDEDRTKRTLTPDPIPLTHEELMLQVRRTMTEILLKVTSKEIETICREERQRYIRKSKASDHRVSAPSGANISATLGLGAYGSESSSDDDSEDSRGRRDSDVELKDIIKKRKADFAKTERSIEDKLAEAESRKANAESRSTTPDVKENQVDARGLGNSQSSPSPNHHSKRSRKRSDSYSENSDSDGGRRRSSSRSTDSGKHYSKRSRSRSYTPDKKNRRSSNVKHSRSRSRSPDYRKRRSRSRSKRDSDRSRSKRSRSRSYSRSKRSRSSSPRRSRDRRSRSYSRRRSRSTSYSKKSRRSSSRSESSRKSRRRSSSSSWGKSKSHRH